MSNVEYGSSGQDGQMTLFSPLFKSLPNTQRKEETSQKNRTKGYKILVSFEYGNFLVANWSHLKNQVFS